MDAWLFLQPTVVWAPFPWCIFVWQWRPIFKFTLSHIPSFRGFEFHARQNRWRNNNSGKTCSYFYFPKPAVFKIEPLIDLSAASQPRPLTIGVNRRSLESISSIFGTHLYRIHTRRIPSDSTIYVPQYFSTRIGSSTLASFIARSTALLCAAQ